MNDLEAGTTVRRTKWPAAGAINLDEAWKQAVASIVAEHTQGLLLDGDLVPRRILAPVREVRRPSNGGPGTSNQLASKSRPYLPYEIVELRSGHRNVLPIKVEHFKLLAPETLVRRVALDPDEGEIAVEKILNDGWILLAPRWGAVARFLDKTAAGWYKKKERPRMHRPLHRATKPSVRSDTEGHNPRRRRLGRAGDDRAWRRKRG